MPHNQTLLIEPKNLGHNILILIWIFLSFVACKQESKNHENLPKIFHKPVIVQNTPLDNIEYFNVNYLDCGGLLFFDKYTFSDTLRIDQRGELKHTYKQDILIEYYHSILQDTLTTDGFQIFVDYPSTLSFKYENTSIGNYYYPVYVVNETLRTKIFIGKDGSASGVHEAADTSDYFMWRPIEYKCIDYCGNGTFGLKIHPGEFAMFLARKYIGPDKGFMRIKLQIGETIYTTSSFMGTFNYNQFRVKQDSGLYKNLQNNKVSTLHESFIGAIPKEFDRE